MSEWPVGTQGPGYNGQSEASTTSEHWPPTIPNQTFPYSDYIHRDRHYFIESDFIFNMDGHRHNDVFMSYSPMRLPSLSKVSLSLGKFPSPRQTRFNESVNTYVDTRKRIRKVQSVDDFDRRSIGASPLPSTARGMNLTGVALRTKGRPNDGLPPLKNKHGDLSQTSFPFKLHKEATSFDFMSRMPTRFTIKPMSLWRQKTDTFLYGKKLNMQRRVINIHEGI